MRSNPVRERRIPCVRAVLQASRGRPSGEGPNGMVPGGGWSNGQSVSNVAHAVRNLKTLISPASRNSLTPLDAATIDNVSRVGTNQTLCTHSAFFIFGEFIRARHK